jgi:pimeloyl-ACP methyl ester carboxylesterase
MAYVEWGAPDNPRVLVCVHGLTRNGRDFDDLARAMASDYRVLCPDIVGRGRSDWLPAGTHYVVPQYVADLMVLIARSGAETVDWVGTSLGGLIGIAIASQPQSPIGRLVLNDVGPRLGAESLHRIAQYLGLAPVFADHAAAELFIRMSGAAFGKLSDAQWRHLTDFSIRPHAGGGCELRYDPAIGSAFRSALQKHDIELWPLWEAISAPTLVLRGAESDLLSVDTLVRMKTSGPRPEVVEFAGVGHAPVLMDFEQIEPVRDFLLRA